MSSDFRQLRYWLASVFSFGMLAMVLSGCSVPWEEDLNTQLQVYGPLRGYVENGNGQRDGYALETPEYAESMNLRLGGILVAASGPPSYYLGFTGTGRYTGHFVVANAGPILIQVTTSRPSTGQWDTRGPSSKALFFIEAPVGALVTLKTHAGQDPEDVRVSVDRDADGENDDQLRPVGTAGEDEISRFAPASRSTIEELSDSRVRVTLSGHPTNEQASNDIQLYYALYPHAPEGRLYDGPFVVDGPSYLVFGAFDAFGEVGMLNEEKLLGGLADDLEFEIPVDGTPVEISLSQPGQQARLAYPVQDGDKFELVIEPSTVGILPNAGLSRMKGGVGRAGGMFYRKYDAQRAPDSDQILLDPDWGYTGTVVVRLTNLYEYAPELVVDGPAMKLEARPSNHHGHVRFSAEPGETLELRVVDLEIDEGQEPGVLRLEVTQRVGIGLVQRQPIEESGAIYRLYIRHSATYLVEVTPEVRETGSVTLELRTPVQ